MTIATFGAGCFWHVEAGFREIDGVTATRVGYAGGFTDSPAYQDVCTHATGHAEVVEVTFDPERVTYAQLLDAFWAMHDPAQVDRQGPDIGTNYRSIILAEGPEQLAQAKASSDQLQLRLSQPIATEIREAAPFFEAEEYHQQYYEKRGISSCAVTVMK